MGQEGATGSVPAEAIEPRRLGLGEVFARTRDAVIVGEAASGRIALVNRAAAELFGYSQDEALGMMIEDLVVPELKRRHREGLERYARTGVGHLIDSGTLAELPARTRRGEHVWIEMSLTPVAGDPDLPGSYVMAIIRDITERKRLEAEVAASQARLAETVAQLERRTTELTLMAELGDLLHSCSTIVEAAQVIRQVARRMFPSCSGALYLFAASRNMLDRICAWGPDASPDPSIGPTDCWALRRGRAHLFDARADGLRCAHVPDAGDEGTLCVPLAAQGETLGLLHLRDAGDAVTAGAEELGVALAEHLGLALANFQLRETLRNQSIRDPLTNLFNRRYMEESVEREVRRAGRHHLPLGVIAIDIDHFKAFNDTHGHEAGDMLLRAFASFLGEHVRSEDFACRQGGEEFLLVLPYAALADVVQRAEQLCTEAASVTVVPRSTLRAQSVTISLGVAAFPDHATTAADLLRAADVALYLAKAAGRNRVVVANPA